MGLYFYVILFEADFRTYGGKHEKYIIGKEVPLQIGDQMITKNKSKDYTTRWTR
jgi:hypothetical protein